MRWIRVNKAHPCTVCKKNHWCSYSVDGKLVYCMRIESDHPAKGGGWIHKLGNEPIAYIEPEKKIIPVSPVEILRMIEGWMKGTTLTQYDLLAASLGCVTTLALKNLSAVWAQGHKAWAFPMKNGRGQVVGIRFRAMNASKWTLRGTHSGLFLHYQPRRVPIVMICEGATDAAAASIFPCEIVGRPACLGCEDMIIEYVTRNHYRRAIIVGDNDSESSNYAGQRGAHKLSEMLTIPNVVWIPPVKDVREFINRGGTYQLIESDIKNMVWTNEKDKTTSRSTVYSSI